MDWDSCKKQVDKFAGAKYKSFPTLKEAEVAFSGKNITQVDKSRAGTTFLDPKKIRPQTTLTYSAEEIAGMPFDTKIFTDGGCEPNPGF